LNRFFFALATACAVRGAQYALGLLIAVQSHAEAEVWAVDGWATVVSFSALYTVCAIGYATNASFARLLSILTDLGWTVIVIKWWSDLPDFGANTTLLAQNLVAPAITLVLALRATPSRRNRQS